jgi:quercetin dioxygenase-like cupin family protein
VADVSKVIRFDGQQWEGVPARPYRDSPSGSSGVTRHTLLGQADYEQSLNFLTRYFEVQPGGSTSLEVHRHPHAVVVLRGAGEVVLEGKTHDLRPFDCVYVAPQAVHQFRAGPREPLGFLCVVDRVRDRPTPVELEHPSDVDSRG